MCPPECSGVKENKLELWELSASPSSSFPLLFPSLHRSVFSNNLKKAWGILLIIWWNMKCMIVSCHLQDKHFYAFCWPTEQLLPLLHPTTMLKRREYRNYWLQHYNYNYYHFHYCLVRNPFYKVHYLTQQHCEISLVIPSKQTKRKVKHFTQVPPTGKLLCWVWSSR